MLIPPALRDVIPAKVDRFPANLGPAGEDPDPRRDRQLRRWSPTIFAPFDYQEQVISGLLRLAETDRVTGMLMLPTGAGKTSTAAATVLRDLRRTGDNDAMLIWIAPQVELLAQAASAIERVWAAGEGPDSLDIAFCRSTANPPKPGRPSVVLSTPLVAERFVTRHDLSSRVHYLVFDEAHHLGAEKFDQSWGRLKGMSPKMRIALGLSATPTRSETATFATLSNALDGKVFYPKALLPNPIVTLTQRGVLARVSFESVRGVPAHCARLERPEDVTRALTGDPDYWMACVTCVKDFAKPMIVYCPERGSARLFVAHLRSIGVEAEYLDGDDSYGVRIATLERFRDGQTKVLVNVQLLLEGIDAPSAAGALITYPIQSSIRLSQIAGRVMRGTALGGTSTATVFCVTEKMVNELRSLCVSGDYGAYWTRGVAF